MKRLLVIALMMVTFTVSAQVSGNRMIADDNGINNMSTMTDVQEYHESDWKVYDTGRSFTGNRTFVFYNDTDIPTVYRYDFVDGKLDRMEISKDKQSVTEAVRLLRIILSEEDEDIIISNDMK